LMDERSNGNAVARGTRARRNERCILSVMDENFGRRKFSY
jgi:hypothetical protein